MSGAVAFGPGGGNKGRFALVAHDACKPELIAWVTRHAPALLPHQLLCTGTTGRLVQGALLPLAKGPLDIVLLKSGPLGGDQQLGARIAEGLVDVLIFFWDPMLAQPHDVDVKALLRVSNLYNVPTACNRATADLLMSSPLLLQSHPAPTLDTEGYLHRPLP